MLRELLLLCVLISVFTDVFTAGEKSWNMCQEYGKAVHSVEVRPVLMARSAFNSVSQCGIVEVPLIVGGQATGVKEFPHQASLGYGRSRKIHWLCGGSLISDNFVLTAAHCVNSPDNGPLRWVKLGDLHMQQVDPPGTCQQIGVKHVISHPDYKARGRYDDIALVELAHAALFTGHVRPACLHTQPELRWATGIATGYGRQQFKSQAENGQLMKVQLELIDSVKCNNTFKAEIKMKTMEHGIIASQFCAGHMQGGKDTCQGDSGGPMQQVLTEPYCMYTIFGVTSFGKFCAFKNSPAVYSRVSHYIDWIERIVWP